MPIQRHTMTWTALAGMPLSFKLAALSSPSEVDDEDDETGFGYVCQSLPVAPAYEPTEMPASPVSTPHEEEEEAAAPLTCTGTCGGASMHDGKAPVLHPASTWAAKMMPDLEGTSYFAYGTAIDLAASFQGRLSSLGTIVLGLWRDALHTVLGNKVQPV
jgi:hypothetical protein